MKFFCCLLPLMTIAVATLFAQDDNGESSQPIKVTTTIHADGTKTVNQSDPDKRTQESTTYDAANKLLGKIIYDLDDQGQIIDGTAFSPKGTLLYKVRYVRDASNRVKEVDTLTATGGLISRQVYYYDAGGRVSKIEMFDANGNPIRQNTNVAAAIPITPPSKSTSTHNH